MFERFTERARQVLVLAQKEAQGLKHNYIGTEHILLGLVREEDGLAARVLASLDLPTVEKLRARVEEIVGLGEEALGGQIPFTPRAKKVCEMSLREALALGHNYIGTEHILLGLVREDAGVAALILLDLDADSEKIRNEVIRLLPGSGERQRKESRLPPNFRCFERLTVFRITGVEGEGRNGDPVREVHRYFAEDGEPLWVDDSWAPA